MSPTRRDNAVASVLAWICALILVLLPFQALITTWPGSVIGHLDLLRIWKEILICALAVPSAWLAWRTPKLRTWLGRSWLARLIYLYTALQLVLGGWAISHHQVTAIALIYALIINLRFLGFFLVCLAIASRSDFLMRNWQKLVLWPGAIVIMFGLLQRFILPYDFLKHFGYSPKTVPAYQTVDANIDYRRIQSTLRGANPLGAYLTLLLPASLFIRRRLLKGIYLLAGLVVLFFSYSRSAWLGLAISLLGLVWLRSGLKLKPRVALAGAACLLAIAAGGLYIFRSNQSLQETLFHISSSSASAQSSNAVRAGDIKTAATDVINQPLGRGPGTAGPASFRNNHPPRIAENYYLQIGQEVGVLGMAVFIAINWLVALALWKARANLLPALLLVGLAGISFINLISHAWADDTLSLIWWGLAGVAAAPAILAGKVKNASKA